MVFSNNIGERDKENIQTIWRIKGQQHYEKYLGLPPTIGRSKKMAFADIEAKMWQNL